MSEILTMEKQASVDAPLMRAAGVTGPGAVRIDHLPRPEPGPGQVRVKLEGCGVCASNLTPWAGPEWQSYPLRPGELGHEGWGVVDAVGEGVTDVQPGDRVATLVVTVPGEDPVEVPLVAGNDVPRLGLIGRLATAVKSIIWGDSR